jgi:hypothetical protein
MGGLMSSSSVHVGSEGAEMLEQGGVEVKLLRDELSPSLWSIWDPLWIIITFFITFGRW